MGNEYLANATIHFAETPFFCNHTWTETVVPPTCVEEGYTEQVCTICGETHTETVPALGHTLGERKITVSPTCTDVGIAAVLCETCGTILEEEVLPATGHNIEYSVVYAPTCQSSGRGEDRCTVCGATVKSYTIPRRAHNINRVETAPTCTEDGTYENWCVNCGFLIAHGPIDALGHDYISEVIEPTPDSDGYTLYTCTRCGDSYKSDPTEYEGDIITAAVGTAYAKIGDTVSVDIIISDAPELKMLSIADLVYDETKLELISGKWTVNAVLSDWDTDTNTGVAVFGKNTNVNGAVFTFTFKVKENIDECTVPVKCTFSARTKPAGGVETTVAVKNVAGAINAVICLHEWTTSVTDATCTEDGEIRTYCTLCGTILKEEVIAATGHSMESTSVDPTCTSDGYTRKVCSACGCEEIFDIIPALGHNFSLHTVEPTCIQDGYSYNCCDRCRVETDRTVIEALGHDECIAEYIQETCFENGYVKYKCARCDEFLREEEIPAAHKYETTVYQATPYATEGYTVYTCTVCGDTYKGDFNTYVENGNAKAVLGCVTGRSGETVTVALDFMNMPGVKALGISDLIYDRNRLEIIDGAWNTDAILYAWDMVKETGVAAFTEKTQLDGTVFTFTFKILEDADDCEIPVYCTIDVRTVDDEGNEVVCDIDTYGGRITVNNVIRGDVNGDGTVDSNDAIFLLKYVGIPEHYTINQSGDMNGDGYVDSDDAIYLLYHVMFSDSEDWKLYE